MFYINTKASGLKIAILMFYINTKAPGLKIAILCTLGATSLETRNHAMYDGYMIVMLIKC